MFNCGIGYALIVQRDQARIDARGARGARPRLRWTIGEVEPARGDGCAIALSTADETESQGLKHEAITKEHDIRDSLVARGHLRVSVRSVFCPRLLGLHPFASPFSLPAAAPT